MMKYTSIAVLLLGFASAEIMMLHNPTPLNDPHHTHCEDVNADMSNPKADAWWSANAWSYPAKDGWKNGSLCDTNSYPVVEHQSEPIGVNSVTLRRLGKSPPLVSIMEQAAPVVRKFEVGDNHCTELVIDMALNNSECQTYEWWTENDWHYVNWGNGTCPKPYTKLDRTDHPIAVKCIDLNEYGVDKVVPLSLSEIADSMIIHNIAPGAAHCTEMYFAGGKDNAYWKNHGYQYPTALWPVGKCDRVKYNWFNRNSTIDVGVTSETWGRHLLSSAATKYATHCLNVFLILCCQ